MAIYYIDTDEIPGFLLSLKRLYRHPRAMKILFLSFTCEDSGVAMVTNIFRERERERERESLLRRVVFYVQISSVSRKSTEHYMAARGYEFNLLVQHSKMKFISPRGHVISSI